MYEAQVVPGAHWPRWRKVTAPKYLILCYHRVGTGGVPLYSELSPATFEAQMRHLKKNYRVISLEQLCSELHDPAAGHGVAVTFDDGYRGIYDYAYPVLLKYQIPATVFLIAQSMETGQVAWYDRVFVSLQLLSSDTLDIELDQSRHFALPSAQHRFRAALEIVVRLRGLPDWRRRECCADLEKRVILPETQLAERILNWEQVQVMHRAGISFGSHTVTHPVVSRLAVEEMARELTESKKIIEGRLGTPVQDFAFPFGSFDDCGSEAGSQLASAGYRCAVTTVHGVNSVGTDPFALRRVQVGGEHNEAMFAFHLTQAFLFSDAEKVWSESPKESHQGSPANRRSAEETRNA
jgi:peptidoglycan/xylan/chitin deacetylase (PgdA/CDA1 family)